MSLLLKKFLTCFFSNATYTSAQEGSSIDMIIMSRLLCLDVKSQYLCTKIPTRKIAETKVLRKIRSISVNTHVTPCLKPSK